MDLVTLYRTIASFEKSAILRRVDLRRDAVFYELNKDHHHHIVCTNCNKIEDFENREVEKVLEKIAKKSTFRSVKNHSLELFGVCSSCAL
jgi:Fur family ferric uptake transcriptional regulator